jgi:hypothetical protein
LRKIEVFIIENGELKRVKVEDWGDFLAYKVYKNADTPTYYAWAKGKPLLFKTSRFGKPKYTFIVCPETAWTLTTKDIVNSIRAGKLEPSSLSQNKEGAVAEKPSGKDENNSQADTFNPSVLHDDKSVAKWLGNIVRNREDESIKNVVTAYKVSKWWYLLLLLFGIMLGFMFPAFFQAFGGAHTVTPPAPTFKPP